jgi:cytochrome c oxidase subunit I+III
MTVGDDGIRRDTPTAGRGSSHEELDALWADPPGLWGKLTAVQNDAIGVRLMLTGFFFLLLGGSFDSFIMRLQLAFPEQALVSPQFYCSPTTAQSRCSS